MKFLTNNFMKLYSICHCTPLHIAVIKNFYLDKIYI